MLHEFFAPMPHAGCANKKSGLLILDGFHLLLGRLASGDVGEVQVWTLNQPGAYNAEGAE